MDFVRGNWYSRSGRFATFWLPDLPATCVCAPLVIPMVCARLRTVFCTGFGVSAGLTAVSFFTCFLDDFLLQAKQANIPLIYFITGASNSYLERGGSCAVWPGFGPFGCWAWAITRFASMLRKAYDSAGDDRRRGVRSSNEDCS